MRRKIICLEVFLGFLFVALLFGPSAAGEADYNFVSCAGWANCDTESPNYTGICCRPCRERERGRMWDCQRVHDETARLGGSSAGQLPTGEATITGIVTKEGVLQADQGQEYAVAANQAVEFQRIMGKRSRSKARFRRRRGRLRSMWMRTS